MFDVHFLFNPLFASIQGLSFYLISLGPFHAGVWADT